MAAQTNVSSKQTTTQSHEIAGGEASQGLFGRTLDEIKAKKMNVEERIEQLRKAGESATKELRAGLEMAWDDLRLSLESALNQFSNTDQTAEAKAQTKKDLH